MGCRVNRFILNFFFLDGNEYTEPGVGPNMGRWQRDPAPGKLFTFPTSTKVVPPAWTDVRRWQNGVRKKEVHWIQNIPLQVCIRIMYVPHR